MKKIMSFMAIVAIVMLGACGPSEEEKAAAQQEAEEAVNAIFDNLNEAAEEATEEATEELAEHVCNEQCTEEACHLMHGEKGHVCTEECAGMEG